MTENKQLTPAEFAALGVEERAAYLTQDYSPVSMAASGVQPAAASQSAQHVMPQAAATTEEPGAFDYVTDTVKGIALGATDAVVETANLIPDAINLFRADDNQLEGFSNPLEDSLELKTGWGKGVKSVSQFVTGMVGAGKFLKAAKLLQGTGKAMAVGRGMAEGAIADFTVFDAHEERLSNVMKDSPLANPITDFLAASPDDSAALGRLKNTIEGMALGAIGEALFMTLKGTRAMRTAKTPEEAAEIAVRTSEEIEAVAARAGQNPEQLGEQVDAVLSGDAQAIDTVTDTVAQAGGKLDLEVNGVKATASLVPEFKNPDAGSFIGLRNSSSRPEFLTPYTAEEMQGWRLFSLDEGVGFALKPDGDIVNVFNTSTRKGAGQDAVIEAIAQGGTKLDCFGDFLTDYYASFGFVENKANRMAWDDAYAPKGWNYEQYGKPDVVYFEYPKGLSRDRGDIRRRFEDARRGKAGRGNDAGHGGIRSPQQPKNPGGEGEGIHLAKPALPEVPTGISGDNVTPGKISGLSQEAATDPAASSVPIATPAQKASLTRSTLKPEEMQRITKDAFDNPEQGLEYLESGEFLLANNKRINVDDFEEVALHGRYAVEAWEKTLKGKGPESFQKVLRQSEEILRATTNEDLLAQAATDHDLMRKLTARVVGYKMAAQTLGRDMIDKWLQIEVHGKTPELMAEFTKLSETYQKLSITAKDMTTSAARVTSAGRISPKYLEPEVMANIMKAADGNPEKIAAVLNAARQGSKWDAVIEYVINGLLSSPITHAVNITGNAIKMALMPTEKMLGGALMGKPEMYREGIETFVGLSKFCSESWEAAKVAWKTGENILDKSHMVMDGNKQPIFGTYEKVRQDILNQKLARGDKSGKLTDLEELQARFYSVIGVPSRALGTMDEFFKQINYRANTYAKLTVEASSLPGKTVQEMAEYVEQGMREAFDANGSGVLKENLRYSQEATWTQNLRDGAYFNGGLGQTFLTATNNYPPLKLVMPFIRTPTNLIRDFVAHTPGLNMLTKRYKDAVAAGGERQAHAYGQMATGAMLWTTAIGLAMNGKMTGGYPKDPATRQAWIDAGIEPYSFKIGDKYISFARLDPFSTLFGLVADYTEYSRNWSDSVKGNFASGAIMALSNNILSKSYLTGLTDLISALGDQSVDSNAMQKWMQRSATMALPYSSGLRFARRATDDSLREVRGMWDTIYNAVPGTSHLLPEKRSWITGKAISHNLFWGENNNDTVTNELARLGDNLELGPPAKRLSGVELDAEQYSRLCELHGSIKLGGKTLHESLTQLMKSSKYDINRRTMPDMPGDVGNPRTDMVEKIINSYRKAAQQRLLRETPELQEAVKTTLKTKVAAKRGDVNRVKELLTKPQ